MTKSNATPRTEALETTTSSEMSRIGNKWLTNGKIVLLVTLLIVAIDQIIKIYVKTHYYLYEETSVTSWFKIVFVQNNGMAFGWELGSKLFLTLFRILFVVLIIYYVVKIKARKDIKPGFMVCVALILAGAIGNIIDCMFYGLIFNNPVPPAIATLFPAGGGYGQFLHGLVVDMFYFPLFSFDWPQWMPFVGGEHFLFFQPVFNFADAAISVGVIVFLLFYSKQFKWDLGKSEAEKTTLKCDKAPESNKSEKSDNPDKTS